MTKPTVCVFWDGEAEYTGWGQTIVGAVEDFIEREIEGCYPVFEDWDNLKMGHGLIFHAHDAIHDLKLSHFFSGATLHDRLHEVFYSIYDTGLDGEEYADELSPYLDDAFAQWMKDHRIKWPFDYCSSPHGFQGHIIAYIHWASGDYESGAPVVHVTKRCKIKPLDWRRNKICFPDRLPLADELPKCNLQRFGGCQSNLCEGGLS